MNAPTPPDYIAVLDGAELDLRHDWVDSVGVVWTWTGKRDRDGRHLMASRLNAAFLHGAQPLPIDVVYRDHGPLIPMLVSAAADAKRAWLEGGAA